MAPTTFSPSVISCTTGVLNSTSAPAAVIFSCSFALISSVESGMFMEVFQLRERLSSS